MSASKSGKPTYARERALVLRRNVDELMRFCHEKNMWKERNVLLFIIDVLDVLLELLRKRMLHPRKEGSHE